MSAIACCVADVENDVLRTDIGAREACFAGADDDDGAVVRRKIVEYNGRNKLPADRVEVACDCCFADGMWVNSILPIDRAIWTV